MVGSTIFPLRAVKVHMLALHFRDMRVPAETLASVCQYLDRFTLDAVEFCSRQCRSFIGINMGELCLRRLESCSISFFGAQQTYVLFGRAHNGQVLTYEGDEEDSWE